MPSVPNDREIRQVTIHRSPREGERRTPCCGMDPLELDAGERMSIDDWNVTCPIVPLLEAEVERLRGEVSRLRSVPTAS